MNIGRQNAEIISTKLKCTQKGTDYVAISVMVGDEQGEISVWLTHRSMGMARAQLAICGFDIEKHGLEALENQPELLRGTVIPVDVDDETYNGKTTRKIQIAMKDKPDPVRIAKLTDEMRKAKAPNMEAATVDEIDEDSIPF